MENNNSTTYMSRIFKSFLKQKLAMISLIFLVLEIVLIILLPYLMKLDPYTVNNMAFGTKPGINGHILGTDSIGRDVFSRLVYGGRVSILVGLVSTLISLIIGVPLGLIAGYLGEVVGSILMRITDIFMSFPAIILVLVFVAVAGPSIYSVSFVIGLMGWTQFARLVYSKVLNIKKSGYVMNARAIGLSNFKIISKYIMPNCLGPTLVASTISMSTAILTESALSFLGMGVQPPAASWGNIIYEAQSIAVLANKPWQWMPAGILILTTILCINFLGDGLRDALDPRVN